MNQGEQVEDVNASRCVLCSGAMESGKGYSMGWFRRRQAIAMARKANEASFMIGSRRLPPQPRGRHLQHESAKLSRSKQSRQVELIPNYSQHF